MDSSKSLAPDSQTEPAEDTKAAKKKKGKKKNVPPQSLRVFKLFNAFGRVRPFRVIKATTESSGSKGSVRKVSELELPLEIGHLEGAGDVDESFSRAMDLVFPGAVELSHKVAAEDDQQGFDWKARGKIPDLTIEVFGIDPRKEESDPVFRVSLARVMGKPQLKISEKGDMVFVTKVRAKFKKSELAKIAQYIDADLWFTAETSQMDVAEAGSGKVVGSIGGAA